VELPVEKGFRPVPVFPLPGLVLFPHVVIPLRVFEHRYRTMVRDALAADRSIAMALLKPGWEGDYAGSPEFHPLLCLARIEDAEWQTDDCYRLSVKGVARAKARRVMREFPYRAVTLETHPEHPLTEDDPLVRMERASLLSQYRRLAHTLERDPAEADGLGFEELVNVACTLAPIEPEVKLALLAEDSVFDRAVKLRACLGRAASGGTAAQGEAN
jgi:Lon protease-like protein